MNFLKKLFGTKEMEKESVIQPTLTAEQKKEAELLAKFNSIFPYFKQSLPSDDNEITEYLPSDLSEIDNTKVYTLPMGKGFVIRNICDDLNCFYAYDNELGLEIIQETELKELKVSREELHEIAMSNYRQLISKKLNAQNNSEAFWFILDGNLEAGLVLVDEIWDQVEEHLKDDIIICVPSRDVIIATGKSNNLVIEDFSKKATEVYLNGDHPLSKNWFLRVNKKWEVFKAYV